MKKQLVVLGVLVAIQLQAVEMGLSVMAATLDESIALYNKGDVAQAIDAFEQMTVSNPNDEDAWLWLARSYKKQGDAASLENAKQAYYQLLRINPNQVEALSTMGEVLSWDVSTRGQAIDYLSRAVDLDPQNLDAMKNLGMVLYWEGRNAEALQQLHAVANYFEGDRKFNEAYADVLSMTGHADLAVNVYETRLNVLQSTDPQLLLLYTRALYKNNQLDHAEHYYKQIKPYVVSSNGDQYIAIKQSLAGLAFDMDKFWDVIEIDQSLPESARSKKSVQLRMARALVRLDRTPEAVDIFHKLYTRGELTATEKIEYADYLRAQNYDDSMMPSADLVQNLYLDAYNENPSNGVVLYRLAQFHQNRKDFTSATKFYQQALTAPGVDTADVKRDYLNYLKSVKDNNTAVEHAFQELMKTYPNDLEIKGFYSEFLSYQPEYRPKAIKVFLQLSQEDPSNSALWLEKMDQTLDWHQPSTELIPLYQSIVNQYPGRKSVQVAIARAYRDNPDYFHEALEMYERLMAQYPDDEKLEEEWAGLLMTYEKKRKEARRIFKAKIDADPSNEVARVNYGKLLSYDRKYKDAIEQFDAVLDYNPSNKEALVAKGYTLIWAGYKLKAKALFKDAYSAYPEDVDIALGFAQSNKMLGQYDDAFRIMNEIRHLIGPYYERKFNRLKNKRRFDYSTVNISSAGDETEVLDTLESRRFGFVYGQSQTVDQDELLRRFNSSVSDTDMEDVAPLPQQLQLNAPPQQRAVKPQPPSVPAYNMVQYGTQAVPSYNQNQYSGQYQPQTTSREAIKASAQMKVIKDDLDSLNSALEALNALKDSSERQLTTLQSDMKTRQDNIPHVMSVREQMEEESLPDTLGMFDMMPNLGLYSAIENDTNPLLSGLGRFKNDDLVEMEAGLHNDLRPLLRAGYYWSDQDGEDSTSAIRYWGFPNQVALSVTPQIRARFSVDPYKYLIPSTRAQYPGKTWSQAYKWGLTWNMTDRLRFNGDMDITHFNQTGANVIDYKAYMEYKFNDSIRAKIGSFREPQLNSLLTIAGLRPNKGAFDGQLLGLNRETGLLAELNTNPFSQNVDLNLGYQWAYVDGKNTPDNTKNLAYASLGYTHHYARHHKFRAAYEFTYFGYDKNSTVGFFDVTNRGLSAPVFSVAPARLANVNYDFGGYYSPKWFFQNAWRLDFRGYFLDKFIEYKIGGHLGVQTFGNGHGIPDGDQTSMTKSADANVIVNFTDWLAGYGAIDWTDAGGAFNRFRFGGGVIIRPGIEWLSPVFLPPKRRITTAPAPQPEPVAYDPPAPPPKRVDPRISLPDPVIFVEPEPEPEPEPPKYVPGYF